MESPGMEVAQLLSQMADPLEEQSQLQGGQVEHQPSENVFWWLPQPPKDCQADGQQDQGCLLGPGPSGPRDGWVQARVGHLLPLRLQVVSGR